MHQDGNFVAKFGFNILGDVTPNETELLAPFELCKTLTDPLQLLSWRLCRICLLLNVDFSRKNLLPDFLS